ncbi:trypsin-like peptidase domain-containing protein [Methanosarcina sp. KYL-1]|uniref:serine protease n=1 Tax=Methanosarcina sp. KYL-1 TaxID=2602068 RepID=UPI002101285B|nr:serine protease [Methanosarcina sp. KYL-1]MCQ1535764.1 trypsin-like peptidase domain-containing protein [Methanosarcina sp. KYL-1]
MIKAGGSFSYKGKRCTIGAVISLKGLPHMVTASHIFRGEGDHLIVDGMEVTVTSILKAFDLALIELPPECAVEITELGCAAELEQALLVNDLHVIKCRVVNAGASLLYLGFRCRDMPQPGDSGSPIMQAGKVVGFISSVTMDNCMGTAISANILRSLIG